MTKPGRQDPLLDNQGEPNLFSTAPIPEQLPQQPLAEQLESQIPAAAKRVLNAEKIEDDAEWERLDKSGYPRTDQQTRKDVGRTMLTAEDIEAAEVAKIKSSYKPTARPKKDRRSLGPNQKNIADGDERVQAIYGKTGS